MMISLRVRPNHCRPISPASFVAAYKFVLSTIVSSMVYGKQKKKIGRLGYANAKAWRQTDERPVQRPRVDERVKLGWWWYLPLYDPCCLALLVHSAADRYSALIISQFRIIQRVMPERQKWFVLLLIIINHLRIFEERQI